MPGSCRGRQRSRKESLLLDSGFTKGQHCLGDSLTPGTLEGWEAVSAGFPWPPSLVASLFALAEIE